MSHTERTPSRRGLLARGTAALLTGAAIATTAHAAPVASLGGAGDDAELIGLCERLIAWEARYDEIYATSEDDDEADRAGAAIGGEYEEIEARLYELDAPGTPEGLRAYARACLATAGKDSASNVMLDQGGNLASFLAFGLAHAIAGRAAA